MADEAQARFDIPAFRGMATNADPQDIEPGQSKYQLNCHSIRQGELEVRKGLRPITFDDES